MHPYDAEAGDIPPFPKKTKTKNIVGCSPIDKGRPRKDRHVVLLEIRTPTYRLGYLSAAKNSTVDGYIIPHHCNFYNDVGDFEDKQV